MLSDWLVESLSTAELQEDKMASLSALKSLSLSMSGGGGREGGLSVKGFYLFSLYTWVYAMRDAKLACRHGRPILFFFLFF